MSEEELKLDSVQSPDGDNYWTSADNIFESRRPRQNSTCACILPTWIFDENNNTSHHSGRWHITCNFHVTKIHKNNTMSAQYYLPPHVAYSCRIVTTTACTCRIRDLKNKVNFFTFWQLGLFSAYSNSAFFLAQKCLFKLCIFLSQKLLTLTLSIFSNCLL